MIFIFSSRRRHTRCYRDWSSDVCSSDLPSPFGAACTGMHNAIAAPRPSTVVVRIRFIRSSLVDPDSYGSSCRFSKYLHVAGAALLHGVDALHRLLNLAHHGKLLAHLEKDLETFGEFLGPIVGLGQAGEHFRVIGFDLVLVALVAPGLQGGDGARVVLLAKIVAAERKVESLVAPSVTRLDRKSTRLN